MENTNKKKGKQSLLCSHSIMVSRRCHFPTEFTFSQQVERPKKQFHSAISITTLVVLT